MKYILILIACLFSSHLKAELQYSKDGDLLDPGMYWAINAREELADIKQGKGNKKRFMNHLKVSASYGFKPAMLSISAIYQNGDYGFEQNLPQAYAWWVLSMGDFTKNHTDSINSFKEVMTAEQNEEAESLLKEYSNFYSQDATIRKFERWFAEATAITGSKLGGDKSFLNVQIQTNERTVSATEYYKRLNKLQEDRFNDLYRVVPQQIKTLDDKKEEKDS
ncbi:MAG: hypothetical protein AB8B80_09735 [Marinicellaceae bacterium]